MRPERRKTEKFAKVEPSSVSDWGTQEDPSTARTARTVAPIIASTSGPDRAMLTQLTGLNAGQVFAADRPEVYIGRGKDADLRLEDAGISRKHARIVHTTDGRYVLEDLRSTNGVFVNGRRTDRATLSSGDRVQLGPTCLLRFDFIDADEEKLARELFDSSTRDSLTRAYNRKYCGQRLATEVAYALRHETQLGVIIFDLDHFKRVNDACGHLAGDVVLRVVAAMVAKMIRAEDVLARYGGEEFVVIARGIEHKNIAVFAERLRRSVERLIIPWEGRSLKVTISAGVASLGECREPRVDALLTLADERLYRAKGEGRNAVCSE